MSITPESRSSGSGREQDGRDRDLLLDRSHMAYRLDGGIGYRAKVGLIALSSDYTIEHEFRRLLDLPGVALFHSRVENSAQIGVATLAAMEARIPQAAGVLVPELELDVVAYGCTSGAMVIGDEKVFARIRETRPGVACTTPLAAARAALGGLGARRVALVAPYVDALNRRLRAWLVAHGVQVPALGSWNLCNDNQVARLSAETVAEAVLTLGGLDAVDAVFVSCTSIRVVAHVQALEARLGKPVISSNLALAWHCLRLAGIREPIAGFGRLFQTGLP